MDEKGVQNYAALMPVQIEHDTVEQRTQDAVRLQTQDHAVRWRMVPSNFDMTHEYIII